MTGAPLSAHSDSERDVPLVVFRSIVALSVLALGSRAWAGAQDFPEAGSAPAPRALTREPGVDAMPAWMPDGRRVVFHARRAGTERDKLPTRKIWIVDRDGKESKQLSQGAADEYHPVPSPDGRKIAFVSD